MSLLVIGLNHRTAPVEIRERVTFGPDIIAGALRSLSQCEGVDEGVILSTCNRTEIYCALDIGADPRLVERWLSSFHGLDAASLANNLYRHRDAAAVEHLLGVAGGLDSMVLGEPQILGQVKNAFQTARGFKTLGKRLGRLFQYTFSVAKQIRTDTAIGCSPVSVAFAAVSLARQIFNDFSRLTALLIGAGETVELAARHLTQQGIGSLIVANRTVERAHTLAQQFDGYAIGLTEIGSHLPQADIIISSTASPLPILGKGAVESALRKRRHKPMFMVDIAVPRDIESEVAELDDVYLYTVDDLDDVIQENIRSRTEAAEQAREMIGFHVEEFMGWLRSLNAVGSIQDIRRHAELQRDELLEKAMRQLRGGKPPEDVLKFLAHSLTNRLLHAPSTELRRAGVEGETELLEAAGRLFQVQSGTSR